MMATARDAAVGQEAVCVSHQLPIWVTRRMAEQAVRCGITRRRGSARWAA